jgi:hypothetical protein
MACRLWLLPFGHLDEAFAVPSGASRNPPSQGSGRGDARNFWRFEWLLAVAVLITNLAVFELAWISVKEGRQRAEELASLSTRDAAQVLDQA